MERLDLFPNYDHDPADTYRQFVAKINEIVDWINSFEQNHFKMYYHEIKENVGKAVENERNQTKTD